MNQSADLQRSLFAIQEYGQLIGFEQLLDEGSQVAAYELESGATISFEALENGVIISRMQQFSPYNIFDTMIKALSMSHYRRGVNYIMQAVCWAMIVLLLPYFYHNSSWCPINLMAR